MKYFMEALAAANEAAEDPEQFERAKEIAHNLLSREGEIEEGDTLGARVLALLLVASTLAEAFINTGK